jgi:hypothetical protein
MPFQPWPALEVAECLASDHALEIPQASTDFRELVGLVASERFTACFEEGVGREMQKLVNEAPDPTPARQPPLWRGAAASAVPLAGGRGDGPCPTFAADLPPP